MLPSGRMVLTVAGKKDLDPLSRDGFLRWSLLSDALVELVSEGIVKKSDVDSFNVPFYKPNEGEVREIVENEGSFEINKIETYKLPFSLKTYDEDDDDYNEQSHAIEVGRTMANFIRAISEPMLVAHFGDTIINRLFDKLAHNASQDYVSIIREQKFSIMVSLTTK